jgi:RNA polymerase sigma-70 factor (ECF subfamily)
MTGTALDRERFGAALRAEWPGILGTLIRYTGSVELAEDATQEAYARALSVRDPALLANPAAWITTVAKRIAIDAVRRDAALRARLPLLVDDPVPDVVPRRIEDDRIELLYLACAPQLEPETRLALALRFVCGVPTEAIADALLVQHAAMSARLTRAKRRIEREGIRFEAPDAGEWAARLDDVLATVYVLYTTGHATPGLQRGDPPPTAVAIELARELHRMHPSDAETAGLLGLLLLTEARSGTRLNGEGRITTLEEADRGRWDAAAIQEGLDLASDALAGGGRFALQGAIAGLHTRARTWRETDWTTIGLFYERLLAVWPSPAAAIARRLTDERRNGFSTGTEGHYSPQALASSPRLGRGRVEDMTGERSYPVLPCPDLDEALEFYRALGFEVTFSQRRPYPCAVVAREDLHIQASGELASGHRAVTASN